METGGQKYYYHYDALGSVVALSGQSGEIAESYRYTPFGKVLDAGSLGNPYLYTGRRYDAETGLYYYRARFYHPDLRRFIEPDPIGYEDGMSLYAYVLNNPVMLNDPSGLKPGDLFSTPTAALLDATPMTNSLTSSSQTEWGGEIVKITLVDGSVLYSATTPRTDGVIIPFLIGLKSRGYAAILSFCIGVMPSIPVLGRSLL